MLPFGFKDATEKLRIKMGICQPKDMWFTTEGVVYKHITICLPLVEKPIRVGQPFNCSPLPVGHTFSQLTSQLVLASEMSLSLRQCYKSSLKICSQFCSKVHKNVLLYIDLVNIKGLLNILAADGLKKIPI